MATLVAKLRAVELEYILEVPLWPQEEVPEAKVVRLRQKAPHEDQAKQIVLQKDTAALTEHQSPIWGKNGTNSNLDLEPSR